MFSSLSQKTETSSLAVNPFAPRHAGEGASFGLGGAKDMSWSKPSRGASVTSGNASDTSRTKKSKGKTWTHANSDTEGRLKVNNPFKGKDGNLSDGGKQKRKPRGEGERKEVELRKGAKKSRDGQKGQQKQNGTAVNGFQHATSAEEDNTSRPSSSSSASSVYETTHSTFQSTDPFAKKVYDRLRRDNISPPSWPSQPGDPKNKGEMAKFRERYEDYRQKVRVSLTKAELIDDPNRRKTLQDAIDFRGICEDMCPEYEKITRITELDVPFPEKDSRTTYPNTSRMVKKLARSAAGQEAPLPMDVRSTATLRRTLDYLIDTLLRNDGNLPTLHGFLWDRTRAIRRDFTFLSTPTTDDLRTQAYVLENVARFHVTALHLLSQPGKAGEDFVEQQELEQLGKALLSLRDLYDDCNAQGIECENEAEFRAYYLIFHAHDSNTIEMLQRQWKPQFWKDSDEIRTAVSLVEAIQNTTDFHGPLKPAPSLAASNAFHSFFRIVEDPSVSYTMACFAECHFPQLRRSMLRAIRRSMARPKGAANDVTAATLNSFLRFDTIEEAVDFAKLHDIEFIPDEQAPTDLSRQFLVLNNKGLLPSPRLQHQFSQNLVEKKRGNRPLPDVIHQTINESSATFETTAKGFSAQSEGSLFVENSHPITSSDPKAVERRNSTTPFTAFGQTPGGLASNFTGGNQATLSTSSIIGSNKNQGFAIPGNPFDTTAAPTNSATLNPFATSPSSEIQSTTTNPFNSTPHLNTPHNAFASPSTAPSGGIATNPFGQSTSPNPLGSLQGLRGNEQPKPSNAFSEKPNTQFGSSANAPLAKNPFGMSEKLGGSNSVMSTFAGDTKQTSENTVTQSDGSPSSNSSGQPSFVANQSTRGSLAAPSTIPSIKLSPATAPTFGSTGSGLNLGPPASVPNQGLSSFSSSGAGLSHSKIEATATSSITNLMDNKANTMPGSSSRLQLGQDKQSDVQSSLSEGGVQSQPPPTYLGTKPSSTLGNTGFIPSTTPPSSPPRTNSSLFSLPNPSSAPVPAPPKKDVLGEFTKWFVNGDNGLMHEFETFMVESILRDVYDKFRKDEEEKKQKEKEEQDNAEAQRFRVYNISLKYFYLWKDNAREKRLKKLRHSGREQFRAFREAQRAAQIKEEQEAIQRSAKQKAELATLNRSGELAILLKNSQRSKRKAEEDLLASGVLSGVVNEQEAVAAILRSETRPSPTLSINGGYGGRSRSGSIASFASTEGGGSKTRALRERLLGAKPGRFRRSLPPMSGEIPSPSRTSRVSKVSERWRLKAMGIVQMPDGTALPESMADEIRRGLRRESSFNRSSSVPRASFAGTARPQSPLSIDQHARKDVAWDSSSITNKRKRSTAEDESGGVAKRGNPDITTHKRVMSDADNLIRELRAMREEMEEGTTWFKSQNGKLQSDIVSRGGTPLDEGSI